MEKFFYSRRGKAVFLLLQHLGIAVITICIATIVLFSTLPMSGSYGTYKYGLNLFERSSKFEDTEVFYYLLADSVDEIIRYAVIRDQMETDGVFDGKKTIDIEEYSRRYEYGKKKSGVKYYLEDLIKWGQYGVTYAEAESEESKQGLKEENAANAITLDESMLLAEIERAAPANVEENLAAIKILERYKTTDGLFLWNYANDALSYEELCAYLQDTVESLSYNYYQYKQFHNTYKEERTNLRYYIITDANNSNNVYTNLSKGTSAAAAEAYIQSLGKSILYDSKNLSYVTNTDIAEEELTNILNRFEYTYSDSYQVMIGLDTNYPAKDAFAVGKSNYDAVIPWIEPFALISLISVCVVILTFIIISITAGRKSREGQIVLLWFDRMNTECSGLIAVSLCALTGGIALVVTSWFYLSNMDKTTILIAIMLGVLLTHMLLMCFYLSLIRRIKAHILWKNSLLYKIIQGITGLFLLLCVNIKKAFLRLCDNGRLVTRTWVPYTLYLAVNGLGLLAIFYCLQRRSTMSIPLFLLLLVLNGSIGLYQYGENKIRKRIADEIGFIRDGNLEYQVNTEGMHGDILAIAQSVNTIGETIQKAVEISMKDERLKADLITNVSHDIRTPLTSIINYVDLLKRENIDNEKIQNYINILDTKSQRLKHLTEDLVEASKISSGNIALQIVPLNLVELLRQSVGEFMENYSNIGLHLVLNIPEHPIIIEADSRQMWRVMENLFRNVEKYALKNTRVYIDMKEITEEKGSKVKLSIKNISEQPLNIDASDLTERFIRGDVSRSTEGSGLGLSIARNLVELQNGQFEIYLDGDLFKVNITFCL